MKKMKKKPEKEVKEQDKFSRAEKKIVCKQSKRKHYIKRARHLGLEANSNLKATLFHSLRPKLQQAAIPRKDKDFFACIMHMKNEM